MKSTTMRRKESTFMVKQLVNSRMASTYRYDKDSMMTTEEHVLIYYVINLILFGQLSKARRSLDDMRKFKLCSQVFLGNVHRFTGIVLFSIFEEQQRKDQNNMPEQ